MFLYDIYTKDMSFYTDSIEECGIDGLYETESEAMEEAYKMISFQIEDDFTAYGERGKLFNKTKDDFIVNVCATEPFFREIAEYLVAEGTELTSTGSWIFDFSEIADQFALNDDFIYDSIDYIVDELCKCKEVLGTDDMVSLEDKTLTVTFGTDYCPYLNEEWIFD